LFVNKYILLLAYSQPSSRVCAMWCALKVCFVNYHILLYIQCFYHSTWKMRKWHTKLYITNSYMPLTCARPRWICCAIVCKCLVHKYELRICLASVHSGGSCHAWRVFRDTVSNVSVIEPFCQCGPIPTVHTTLSITSMLPWCGAFKIFTHMIDIWTSSRQTKDRNPIVHTKALLEMVLA
jgi:hypothetical protein